MSQEPGLGTHGTEVKLSTGERLFRVELGPDPGTISLAIFAPERRGRMVAVGLYSVDQMSGLEAAIGKVLAVARVDLAQAPAVGSVL